MKKIPLLSVIFLLFFFGETDLTRLMREPARLVERLHSAAEQPSRRKSEQEILQQLRQPFSTTAQNCLENSRGPICESPTNIVSTCGHLKAWIQKQFWRPEKQIILDKSLKPQVILTFSNREYGVESADLENRRTGPFFSDRQDKKS